MHFAVLSSTLLVFISQAAARNVSDIIGYNCHPTCYQSTISANETKTLNFGKYYAVLNLDVSKYATTPFENTTKGAEWISNLEHWIHVVHQQRPPPLSVYTTLSYLNNRKPELGVQSGDPAPFNKDGMQWGVFGTPETKIYHKFAPNETAGDVVLAKSRFYAGTGNQLETILSSQKIDTVILSGIATSGVVISTAFRLFDLNYNVFVILNNTIQAGPKGNNTEVNHAILQGMLPFLSVNVISIEQAEEALKRSGPAKY